MHEKRIVPILILLVIWSAIQVGWTVSVAATSNGPEMIKDKDFVIVTVKSEESLASLARQHLGSIDMAWQIADYNGIDKVKPGQRVVIPLRPITYSGLSQGGYQEVPVLYYPKITAAPTNTKAVSAGDFEKQLQFLRGNGYKTASLDLLYAFLNFEGQLPPKTVIITFDATERWVYDIAYPILLRNGFRAALFIRTDRIDQSGHLTWTEVSKLAAAGFDIGTSGLSAKRLTYIERGSDAEAHIKALEREISEPQEIIQANLKRPCHYFAYPGGMTNDLVIALLKKYRYKAAFTRKSGSNPFFVDNFKIQRSLIRNEKDPLKFCEHLSTFSSVDLR